MASRLPLAVWGHVGGCLAQHDWARLACVSATHRLASKQAHATPALLRISRKMDDRTPDYRVLFAYLRPRSVATEAARGGPSETLVGALPALARTLTSLALERRTGPAVSFAPLAQLTALRHLRLVVGVDRYSPPVFPSTLTSLDFRLVAGAMYAAARPTWYALSLPSATLVALELRVCDDANVESADLEERLASLSALVTTSRFEPLLRRSDRVFPKLVRLTSGGVTRCLRPREFPALAALSLCDPEQRDHTGVRAALVLELIESLPTLVDLTLDVVDVFGFSSDPVAAATDNHLKTRASSNSSSSSSSSSSPSSSSVSASTSANGSPRRQLRRLTFKNFVTPLFCQCLARRSALDMEQLVVHAAAFYHRAFAAHSIATVEVTHLELGAATTYVVPTGRFVRTRSGEPYPERPADALDPGGFRVSQVGRVATLVALEPRDIDACARLGMTDVARPHTLDVRRLLPMGDTFVSQRLSAICALFPHVRAVRLPAYTLCGRDNSVAAALADFYARLADLEVIDLSNFSIGDLEPPVSPREFVEHYLRPEQRRLVTRLPSVS